MAFNLFKRGKEEKAQVKTAGPLVVKKEAPKKKEEVKKEVVSKGKSKNGAPFSSSVLLNPHITEKASMLAEKGQYVFRVHTEATKGSVKKSVESIYGVNVKGVRLTTKPGRKVRAGRKMGFKSGMKKAVVHLKEGQTIDIIAR